MDSYRPWRGHYNQNTLIHSNGCLSAILHIAGDNAELLAENGVTLGVNRINQLALNSTSPRLEWWEHFTRIDGQIAPALPACNSWWADSLDAALRDNCMQSFYRNDLFFTIVMRPVDVVGELLRGIGKLMRLGSPASRIPTAVKSFHQEFEDKVAAAMSAFSGIAVRRLGLEARGGVWFSEIAEALYVIANGHYHCQPLPRGKARIGRQITPFRPVFGDGALEQERSPTNKFCSVAGLLAYPKMTHALMYERLRRAPFPIVITNSFLFQRNANVAVRLANKVKHIGATGDASEDDKTGVKAAENKVNSGDVAWGAHHISIAVRGPDVEELDRRMTKAIDWMSVAGATFARYDHNTLKAGYLAQLPGNARFRVKREGISSEDFAGFAALNNVPAGHPKSRWGAPLMYLRSTANTMFPDHFHVIGDQSIPAEDVGSWVRTGGMGSGKTSRTTKQIALCGRVGADAIVFDKDCGTAPLILAEGGEYLVLEDGQASGVAPLLAAKPADLDHLHRLFKGLIEQDDQGDIEANDDRRLAELIAWQLTLPVEIRGLGAIQQLLDNRAQNGAGARLHKWVRGQRLGWAFDGPVNQLDLRLRRVGIDTTALLKNETVCGPMLAHLFYRIQERVYAKKPLLIVLEECHLTLKRKQFVDEFNDHSKTIRKNEGVIGFVTQSPHDLLESPMAHTIKQNVPTKEFFGDPNADYRTLVGGFGLTDREFRIVKYVLPTLRHAFLRKQPGASFIAIDDMSAIPGKVAVLSGRRATYDLALILRERYGCEPQQWVPHYERLAPFIVRDPHLDPYDLIDAKTRAIRELLAS